MTNLFNEIEQVKKRTLKGLHDSLAIDFNKPFELFKVEGKTTLNKIIKDTNLHNDSYGILLIKDKKEYCGKISYRFKVIVFNFCGDYTINLKTGWNNGIDHYYRKADFEKDRKKEDFIGYVFKIKKSDLLFNMKDFKEYNTFYYSENQEKTIKNEFEHDEKLTHRARINKTAEYMSNGHGNRTAYKFYGVKLDNGNIDFTYETLYYRPIDSFQDNDLIDKSGYNVWLKREKLKSHAGTIRAERDLKSLNNMDFSKQNNIIEDRLQRTKNDLIGHLQSADFTSENYMQAVKNLSKLHEIYNDFQRHLKNLQEAKTGENTSYWSSYHAPDDALSAIVDLNNSMDNLAM